MAIFEWTRTSTANLLYHQEKMGADESRSRTAEVPQKIKGMDRDTYCKQVNLWILAAGMLDGLKADDFYIAEAPERYKAEFFEFRASHAKEAGNFANVEDIRETLHKFVFYHAEVFAEVKDSFLLLEAAVRANTNTRRTSA